ncbi:dehydrogenase/reductase SDR family member 11 [Lepeophtheirus salmonis]|uniref:dehydrogenase/reductase SDR family member 11 n=1 Tax=Lepeophtheirus salmonis TaxID=72036 RepID=UPI001AE1500D|nr:dehydrogenase/reductase SDR family member 11-like [Lepeophtheirus salmonis]
MEETKVALITGASSGIGAAVLRRLASKGFIVVGCARRVELIEEIASEFPSGRVFPYKCDITSESELKTMFDWVKDKFPETLRIVFANAGCSIDKGLMEGDFTTWRKLMDVNLISPSALTQYAIKYWTDKSPEKGYGKIVYLNSLSAHVRVFRDILRFYGVTKDALNSLARYWRDEVKEKFPNHSICIGEICPGLVKTDFLGAMLGKDDIKTKHINDYFLTAPFILPEEIADAFEHMISTPKNIQIEDIVIRNTKQVL